MQITKAWEQFCNKEYHDYDPFTESLIACCRGLMDEDLLTKVLNQDDVSTLEGEPSPLIRTIQQALEGYIDSGSNSIDSDTLCPPITLDNRFSTVDDTASDTNNDRYIVNICSDVIPFKLGNELVGSSEVLEVYDSTTSISVGDFLIEIQGCDVKFKNFSTALLALVKPLKIVFRKGTNSTSRPIHFNIQPGFDDTDDLLDNNPLVFSDSID